MKRGKKLLALLLTATMLVFEAVPVCAAVDESSQTETAVEVDAVGSEATAIETTIDAAGDETDVANTEAVVLGEVEEADAGDDIVEIVLGVTPEEETDIDIDEDIDIAEALPCVDDEYFCSDADVRADKYDLSNRIDNLDTLNEGTDYFNNQIVVAADDDEAAQEYAEAFGGTLLHFEYGYALIELNTNPDLPEVSVEDVVEASADYEVPLPAASPNYIGEFLGDVSDSDVAETVAEAALANTEVSNDSAAYNRYIYNDPCLLESDPNYQWQHYQMQSNKAWQAGYTGQNVRVAVIDSGVQNGHEDIKTLSGYYAYNGSDLISTTQSDDVGHGTHCIGIVGATANNGKGGAGIAPGANLYAVKVDEVIEGQNVPNMYAVFLAINRAVAEWDVNVISMSLGAKGNPVYLQEAVDTAYANGTAVFVADGNDYGNVLNYPAAYKNAIAVAAVDTNNQMAYFSDYSSKTRYTGPGVDIYSTYNGGSDSYKSMGGTSMATPAVAGAAAVFLSSGKVAGAGPKKVDNLLALMDKSCVASGTGRGTPNLAKGLGLATTNSAPLAPVVTLNGNVMKTSFTSTEASVTVDVSAEIGATIYYSLNNGNIKIKDGTIPSNAVKLGTTSGQITVSGAASNKLYLVAVSGNNSLVSKEAVYTIKLEPKVSDISIYALNDINSVAKGGSIQLYAGIIPFYAKNKALTWELVSPADGVTVAANGKVSVKATSTASTAKVRAVAKDGSNIASAPFTITITEPLVIKAIKVTPTAITLSDGENASPVVLTTYKDGTTTTDPTIYNWVSSNMAVAKAGFSGGQLVIRGVALGKATITGIDKSGQDKKVTINVTVTQKIKSITITGPARVAQGKKLTPVAVITPEKVTDKKLNWEIVSCPSGYSVANCGVSITKTSGAVTVKADAALGNYIIRATANDAGKETNIFAFEVISSANIIKKLSTNVNEVRLFRVSNSTGAPTEDSFKITFDQGSFNNVNVVSSAPDMVKVTGISRTNGLVSLKATGKATGKAKITVTSTDGSALKKEVTVYVVNPVTKLYIAPPKGKDPVLAYSKTMKLSPVFVAENGDIDAKAKTLEWTSSNPAALSVDRNGNAKALDIDGAEPVTVTARTTDGSNMAASYTVYPCGMVWAFQSENCGDFIYFRAITHGDWWGYYNYLYYSYTYTISGPSTLIQGQLAQVNRNYGVLYLRNLYEYDSQNFTKPKDGNYTVTIKRNDGSGKAVRQIVKVKNGRIQ